MRSVGLGCLVASLLITSAVAAPGAKLRGLDKVSGVAHDFNAPLNSPVRFGKLEVRVRACQQTPPEEQRPETSAFLEIKQAEATKAAGGIAAGKMVFEGWMFASNPALNALEHPTYDVWVISCTN